MQNHSGSIGVLPPPGIPMIFLMFLIISTLIMKKDPVPTGGSSITFSTTRPVANLPGHLMENKTKVLQPSNIPLIN